MTQTKNTKTKDLRNITRSSKILTQFTHRVHCNTYKQHVQLYTERTPHRVHIKYLTGTLNMFHTRNRLLYMSTTENAPVRVSGRTLHNASACCSRIVYQKTPAHLTRRAVMSQAHNVREWERPTLNKTLPHHQSSPPPPRLSYHRINIRPLQHGRAPGGGGGGGQWPSPSDPVPVSRRRHRRRSAGR